MTPRLKYTLYRFARALGAAGVATAITYVPVLGESLPGMEWTVPVLTALLLACDKWLRSGAKA